MLEGREQLEFPAGDCPGDHGRGIAVNEQQRGLRATEDAEHSDAEVSAAVRIRDLSHPVVKKTGRQERQIDR